VADYTVRVTREGTLWVAGVAGDLGKGIVATADYERFADIEPGMREVIADATDRDPASFTIALRYAFGGPDTTWRVREYLAAERAAQAAQERCDRARADLITALHGSLSLRAIADLVGLSHQRVHQIVHETGNGPAA
jgi:hypothetical protein